jgi:hypothetical protein
METIEVESFHIKFDGEGFFDGWWGTWYICCLWFVEKEFEDFVEEVDIPGDVELIDFDIDLI